MLIHDVAAIDLSKYKRLFVFGCSFTNYFWPTWADILRSEMPHATFYNYGVSGAGNMYIAISIIEIAEKFEFNETDLIVPMWTTYFREDRYVKDKWIVPGNIFTQSHVYNEDFVKKFACPRGYVIRDLAMITAMKHFLTLAKCDSIMLSSILPDGQIPGIDIEDVTKLYSNTLISMQKPLAEVLRPPNNPTAFPWPPTIKYNDVDNAKIHHDYHPDPSQYRFYMEKIGFSLTDKSMQLVDNYLLSLRQATPMFEPIILSNLRNLWINPVLRRL